MATTIGIDFGSKITRTALFREGEVEALANRFSEGRQPILMEASPPPADCSGLRDLPLSFVSLKQKAGAAERLEGPKGTDTVYNAIIDIFRQIRDDMRIAVTEPVEGVVFAVPGFFPERPRAALREAALQAGFPAVKLFDDALAAVMGTDNLPDRGNILVYGLGAGVFSTAVVRISGGRPRVVSSEGNRFLGGASFDAALIGLVLKKLGISEPVSALVDAIPRLHPLVEQLKISLSKREQEEIELNCGELFGRGGPTTLLVTRAEFEGLIQTAIETTIAQSRKAVADASLGVGSIERVLMIGGSTRIPLVERLLSREFTAPIVRAPDLAIAQGAARQGGLLEAADWKRKENGQAAAEAESPAPVRPAAEGNWVALFSDPIQSAERLWNAGERQKAAGEMEEVLRQLKQYLGTLYHQIASESLRVGRYPEALSHVERALRFSPEDRHILQTLHEIMNHTARALYEQGRYQEARSMIRQALKLNTRCPSCLQISDAIEAALAGGSSGPPKPRRRR